MSFGGSRIDAAIAKELMRVVEPMAIEAALQAEQMHMDTMNEQRRIIELELQQAQYEATLAERRYAACDPDNRLIAAQLEKNWEAALRRVQACQARLETAGTPTAAIPAPDFTKLAEDLDAAWNAPGVTMRMRQQLVRALIVDIVADVDETAREIILTIHWQGGQHSQLRIRKPKTGEHGCSTSDEALAVIRSMASPMVRSGHRCIAKPDGDTDRPGQDLDRTSRQLYTERTRHPRLQVGREGWGMVDDVRGCKAAWRHPLHDPATDQRSGSACRTSGARRPLADSCK